MSTTNSPALPAPLGDVTFRMFLDPDDIPGMAAANAAVRADLAILEPIDVEGMRHDYAHLANSVPRNDVILAERERRTVGYARVSWADQFDGSRSYQTIVIVHPAVRGRSVAAALLRWSEARQDAIVAADPGTHGDGRERWRSGFAPERDLEVRAALEDAGYRVSHRYAEMLHDNLDGELPDHPLPDGFEIRPVGPSHARAVFDAGVDAFSDTFGEPIPTETDFVGWRDDPRRDDSLAVVAYAGDEIAGYVVNILETRPDGSVRGLLDSVATRAPYRRRGLARALVARSLRLIRERGAGSAYLGVDLQNPRQALTLYESCGFRVVTGELGYRRPFDRPWTGEAG